MLIVMKSHAPKRIQICERIEVSASVPTPCRARSAPPSASPATERLETGGFEEMPGVQEIIRVSKPYKLVSRE